ncbi:bifunctional 5,10-methylenetetrahydrofolate dehydrogenase/5,10-methenyltetrahydrofolate cyclohydrolase [Ancylomarina sp. 16SWW S1-10-2]|uniref:bifunctional 5,10-methylenetetrahydrofolate dehydrogenase/5,10-methenyltetrahydrofolate cyclohydrolase n=1 Tax=Ancylomarina sp. 16SWW S1-10-2 TaxID=2499681 RepID=UPI0012ADE2DD|nr:tetrahydrofolate dehydrogenase/cyclohydrolase catalytic domain-containing protein [Ancylomarina sp. 16SWW S1-10-2]MRT93326.1 bifunctional 5,10-methylene-tetrahydrofolate dehydrogenase/5,10-methylene-tetrahydrofolate cyclohydrolase [Ancylomarina sp. 16SWW S1-10-2]
MQLIDGKKISAEVKQEIAAEVVELIKKGGKKPHLAAIIVGHDGASETYVAAKVKACHQVGFDSSEFRFEDTITEDELLAEIKKVNQDDSVDGLIVQLPLPKHISESKVIETICPEKDVDGFHPMNVGKMVATLPTYLPATPAGIVELLKRYKIETSGKNCVVLGRSNIVGTPMSILMSRKATHGDCTVTLCHSRTKNIPEITREADIVIVALGMPEFLTKDMVKEGATVIDVGIHRIKSDKTKSGWKLIGDVKFDEVAPKCSFITPVPGGVGPMTIVSLLQNTLLASKKEIYS